MALTITIEGKGVIANCDSLIDDTGGSGVDDWLEVGGGSITDESDAFLYGTTSIGNQYASKAGWTYFVMNTPLDFDVAGTEEGQFIYIWLNIAAPNAFDTLANEGFAIRIGNSTTVYNNYIIAGEDDSNGWSGGWKLFVLDPTRTPSSFNGSVDIGAIDYIGIWIDTNVSVRADSIFIDQIAVGTGLRITGTWDSVTYDGAWEEAVAYCNDYANRAWGMLQERDGIYYAFGKMYIGDSTQSVDTVFADSGRVIQFGTTQYWMSGGGWTSTIPTDACGIIIEDHANYTTDFTDGIAVSPDKGRSGSVIIGNADQDIILDLYGGNNSSSVTALYGTIFKACTGAINFGNNTGHLIYGVSFIQCSQVDPVGAPVIRNCTFAETASLDAALLWNNSIDIQKCSFIANIDGAGVEHPDDTNTPFTHTDLVYSGNDDDILNSDIGAIVITKEGISDPSSYDASGSEVTFQASLTMTITVQNTNTDLISDAWVGIYKTSDRTELMKEETVAGVATEPYTGGTPVDVEIRVRKASSGDPVQYKNFSTLASLDGNFSLLVTLEEDTINNATT